jgi:DNA topoisomerase III
MKFLTIISAKYSIFARGLIIANILSYRHLFISFHASSLLYDAYRSHIHTYLGLLLVILVKMPTTVLSVAEKPSVAKELAKILAGGEANYQRRPGHSQYNQLFEINNCPFRGQRVNMVLTSVTGHLMEIEFEREFKSWNGCRPLELFEAPIKKSVKKENEKIETTLIEQARRAQVLLLWLDCDTEGENIAYEVIDVCMKANPRLDIYRARFSALIERDIFRTVNNPDRPNKHFSDAVDARQEIDLRLGAAFTRFQTLRLQARYAKLKDVLVSYGPCQFPTLGFVVDRHLKIEAFKPETFWGINCSYECNDPDERSGKLTCHFSWNRGHIYDRYVCTVLYDSCLENGGNAIVMSVDAKPTTRYRPAPMNTIELQRKSSIFLRIGSDQTMAIAEALYQRGILSYPRTETDFFKEGFDLETIINEQRTHSQWGEYAAGLLDQNKFLWPKNGGHDDQAHPPIHPTKCVNPNDFQSDDERKLYDLVSRHFLACCSHDGKGNQTTIVIRIPDIHGELFTATGLMVLERNWLDVYTYEKWIGNKVPKFEVGDEFTPKSLVMTSGVTAPPLPISESDLISEMDKNGIGTDATIAEHIKTIQKREYVIKDPQNRFIPTKLGLALVEAYNSMGYQLTKPNLRAAMEADCHKIARGELTKEHVIRGCITKMRECFIAVNQEAHKLDSAVSKYFNEFENIEDQNLYQVIQNQLSRCGRCQNLMDLKQEMNAGANPNDHLRRLLCCQTCNKALIVPSKGNLRAHDINCAICSYQVITITNRETQKEHHVCPNCFKNPPAPPLAEDGVSEFRCFNCAHTTCTLAGRMEGAEVDIAPCADRACSGKMRITKNQRGYVIACNRQGCSRSIWWLPQRSIKSAIPKADSICIHCQQRRGHVVVKIALVIDLRNSPFGMRPEALVCPCCSDIWEEWNMTCLPLPSSMNPAQQQPTDHPQLQFQALPAPAVTSLVVTSDYGAALTGANVATGKGKRSVVKTATATAIVATGASIAASAGDIPNCLCGMAAKSCVTVKEGPNKGRPFYTCSSR